MKTKTFSVFFFAVLAVSVTRLFAFPVTEAATNTPKTVILGGHAIGVKLYTEGIHVLKLSDVQTTDGLKEPAKKAGIKKGDYITHVDNEEITSYEAFSNAIQNKLQVKLTILRDGDTIYKTLYPAKDKTNIDRAGIWVRDSAAGIGTLTYFDPETSTAVALGHGITDTDTKALLFPKRGIAQKVAINSVTKGSSGVPGEINGVFLNEAPVLGELTHNTEAGAYFKFENFKGTEIPVAGPENIHEGKAYIYSTIDGQEIKPYTVNITKIIRSSIFMPKGMMIEVTDLNLIKKTGGVVCGMSGSPVVQDGKLVGAVTHVFVNDPTKGYGIFIENMMTKTN